MNETAGCVMGMLEEETTLNKELTLSEHRKEFIFETLEQRPMIVHAPAILMQHKKIISMGKDQPSLMRRVNKVPT